jgi:hypothetical protein
MGVEANRKDAARDGGVQRVMANREDEERQDAGAEITRHLIDAIEQVRLDMAKVELWAYAVSGFSRSVPAYDPREMTIWLPSEQSKKLDQGQE